MVCTNRPVVEDKGMTTLKPSTTRQLNKLIEFRQKVYEQILSGASDAQFELIDALLLSEHLRCFAELSLSPAFRRRWPSAYSAIDDGQQSSYWLGQCFEQQVPRQGGFSVRYDRVAALECSDLGRVGLCPQSNQGLEKAIDRPRPFVLDVDLDAGTRPKLVTDHQYPPDRAAAKRHRSWGQSGQTPMSAAS